MQWLGNLGPSPASIWVHIISIQFVNKHDFAAWYSQVEALFEKIRRAALPGQQIVMLFETSSVIHQAYPVACQADEVHLGEKSHGRLLHRELDLVPVCRIRKLVIQSVTFYSRMSREFIEATLPFLKALDIQNDDRFVGGFLTTNIDPSALARLVDLTVTNVSIQGLSAWLGAWAACHNRPLGKVLVTNLDAGGLLVVPSAAVGPHTSVISDINTQIGSNDHKMAYFAGDGELQTPDSCATMRPRIMTLQGNESLRRPLRLNATVVGGCVACDLLVQASSSRALVVGVTVVDDSFTGPLFNGPSFSGLDPALWDGDGELGKGGVQFVQRQAAVRFPTAIITLCRLQEDVERHCVVHAERLRNASVATVHRMVRDLGLFESKAYMFNCPVSTAGAGTALEQLPAPEVAGSAARSCAALAVAARAWREDWCDTLLHGVYRYLALAECLGLLRATSGTHPVQRDDQQLAD